MLKTLIYEVLWTVNEVRKFGVESVSAERRDTWEIQRMGLQRKLYNQSLIRLPMLSSPFERT